MPVVEAVVVESGTLASLFGGRVSAVVEFPSLTWLGEFTATVGACFVPRCSIHTIKPPSATITAAATAIAGVLSANPSNNDPVPTHLACAAIPARKRKSKSLSVVTGSRLVKSTRKRPRAHRNARHVDHAAT